MVEKFRGREKDSHADRTLRGTTAKDGEDDDRKKYSFGLEIHVQVIQITY